ncbi:flagellin N-terminal helical domain-containing protein [Hydrogenovibrio halophilus]|uniref:flagellin N-terminal helical domain-containing protein n=1 Tax=Hydrogenovibrio halophilus TaxID=373391 RepID=UPI00039B39D1|nr:flagellin [Hydrogenovibrio halophilus]
MAMGINTNMGAINANRILDQTSRAQETTMERLTSGLRINRSADDAAGLAVTTGMKTQTIGTEMAIRNANDGIGLVQTVDGASEEVTNMMQRMRELGIQSMNGTYNNDNRQQMQVEFRQLQLEIDRVADTTKFNGMSVMTTVSANGFAMLSAGAVNQAAASGFVVQQGLASGLQLQVGWETDTDWGKASVNTIGVALMDFKTLSARSETVKLLAGVSASFAANVSVARGAVAIIDAGLSAMKTMRSHWGAVQNRLDYTVSNLQNVNENIEGARARIEDADFAKESAELARTQVLQQAGQTMLSQANQQSQQVLSLLQ